MSLTSDFLSNYQKFMKGQAILIPNGIQERNGSFKFQAQGAYAAVLQSANSGSTIRAFYAKPFANNNNAYALPTQIKKPYFMLTDQMNGCQFMAYGPDRQHVTVEHNNFIGNPANYAARLNTIQLQNNAYIFHISAGVSNIAGGTYNNLYGINIVGDYTKNSGWRFWVRDRVDQNQGQLYGPF